MPTRNSKYALLYLSWNEIWGAACSFFPTLGFSISIFFKIVSANSSKMILMKGKPPLLEVQFCWVGLCYTPLQNSDLLKTELNLFFLLSKEGIIWIGLVLREYSICIAYMKANIQGRRCLRLHIKKVKVMLLSITSIAFLSQKQVPCNWDDEFKKGVTEEHTARSHSRDKKQGR